MRRREFLIAATGAHVALALGGLSPWAFAGPNSKVERNSKIFIQEKSLSLSSKVVVKSSKYNVEGAGAFDLGEKVAFSLKNELGEATSFQWIGPTFALKDNDNNILPAGGSRETDVLLSRPGTHWLRPAMFHAHQYATGAALPIIVKGENAKDYDVDLPVVIQDWSVSSDGHLHEFEDRSLDGRSGQIGQYLTLNQALEFTKEIPAGSRVRLRAINACPSRTVVVTNSHPETQKLWVIARDGFPAGYRPKKIDHGVALGPGQTADMVFDMPEEGGSFELSDTRYKTETIAKFQATNSGSFTVRREYPPVPDIKGMPSEDVVDPNFQPTKKITIEINGGFKNDLDERFTSQGIQWLINGSPGSLDEVVAAITARKQSTIAFKNNTNVEQCIHLQGAHGYVDGVESYYGTSILLMPKSTGQITLLPGAASSISFYSGNYNHFRSGVQGLIAVRSV